MKARYLLFAGDGRAPNGGWADFQGGFGSADAAAEKGQSLEYGWWHVVDIETCLVVLDSDLAGAIAR